MMRSCVVLGLGLAAMGCSGDHGMPWSSMVGPGMGAGGSRSAVMNVAGTWEGLWMDSSGASTGHMMTGGWMMGAGWMGTAMWDLRHHADGSFDGRMWFSDFSGGTTPTVFGRVTGDQVRFEVDLPEGSLPAKGCSAHASGVARIDGEQMTGSYSGTNSCTGAFDSGEMRLTRR